MRRLRLHRSKSLVFAGLLLAVLANIGLAVHSGRHSPGVPHTGTTVQVLAGHSEPDPTLHLEAASEVRILTCLGCLLDHQLGGLAFRSNRSLHRTQLIEAVVAAELTVPIALVPAANRTRGPPSC